MADAFLEWNGDFQISPTGGLLLANGDDFARQRIERRLFTAVQGYIFDLGYGAGLPQKIGAPATVSALTALVRSQIALESSVAVSPAPTVSVAADAQSQGLFYVTVNYFAAATGEPVTLKFSSQQ